MYSTLIQVKEHLFNVTILLVLAGWLSALVGAVIYFVWQHDLPNKTLAAFFRYTFPWGLITNKSTRRDVVFSVINHITEPFTVAPLVIGTAGASLSVYACLGWLFGDFAPRPASTGVWLATLLAVLFVQDFTTWLTHWAEHKVPVMWEIHKVHHSLETMTPISNRRHHPWQLVWEGGVSGVLAGLTLGVSAYVFQTHVVDNALLGVDAYYIASVLSFYHLRHSHIPLHYGRWEKWFLSPSQHQLHHSLEVRDWDRNFGLLTSFWDRLFGTINYTVSGYRYKIGLQARHSREYDTVWKFFYTPIYNICGMAAGLIRTRRRTKIAESDSLSAAQAEMLDIDPSPITP
jgi:sterol desaturase/sphingolipid hydroxylase (fatty acid hydroxylase superfamily)